MIALLKPDTEDVRQIAVGQIAAFKIILARISATVTSALRPRQFVTVDWMLWCRATFMITLGREISLFSKWVWQMLSTT